MRTGDIKLYLRVEETKYVFNEDNHNSQVSGRVHAHSGTHVECRLTLALGRVHANYCTQVECMLTLALGRVHAHSDTR